MKQRTVRPAAALMPVALALILCAGLLAGLVTAPGSPHFRTVASTTAESAVTKSGTGDFASLRVTVNRTKNLIDQVVPVSWSGGTQTQPTSSFAVNYLQIMQCWSDAAHPLNPEQCQFGGKAAFDQRGGNFTATRQLNYGGTLVDRLQKLPAPTASGQSFAGFRSVTDPRTVVAGNTNQYFDSSTTNEIPYARTRGDGRGQEYFETQTALEASGLGCGRVVSGTTPQCWLVVVPRNAREVDGSVRDASNVNQLQSSPLSASNWKNRIAFPLSFAPVGDNCPIGAAERATVGVETIAEAVSRWQPTLCANRGPVFGYSQATDSVTNRQVLADPPGMVFVTSGLPTAQVSSERQLYYAPVALSGLTISFLIESQSGPNAPPAVKARDGARITTLNLTPRLVAKLLTQSYLLGVNPTAGYLEDNPSDLTRDPDFLALNPAFKDLAFKTPIADLLVPEGLSKSNELLWKWIGSDAAARDFVAGQPDPWGMRVNPFYQGQSVDRDDFPKVDPYCLTYPQGGPAPLCTLDAHPYAAGFHDAALAASRGDQLSRTAWDPNALPPAYKKTPLQLNGRRAILALCDTATAARFGLTPARLRNGAGQFMAPVDASILAGARQMTPSAVPHVLAPNPASPARDAYPLVSVTYAATAPSALTAAEAKDYAGFIRYAIGPGQVSGLNPGELPDGYVPLPQVMRQQSAYAATLVESRAGGPQPQPAPAPAPSTAPSGTTGVNPGSSDGGGTDGSGTDLGGSDLGGSDGGGTDASGSDLGDTGTDDGGSTDAPAGDAPSDPAAADDTTTGKPATSSSGTSNLPSAANAARARTPQDLPGAVRYVLPVVLVIGGLAATGGPALPLLRRRMRRPKT